MKNTTIIGVDLGGTGLRAGRLQGDAIVQRCARAVPVTENEEDVLQEIIGAIENVFDSTVEGIGIGVPSIVDVERGIVYTVVNIPSWKEVHLKEKLEREFRVPVHVNNDANCFALGECHYGKGRGFRHMVGITLGTGLGAGIIIDRRLYNGSNCGAGEIGTIPYKDETVEQYCSGQFFPRVYGLSGEAAFEHASEGDKSALDMYEEFGREMAHAIMIAMYAFDPEMIILGGSVSRAFGFFKPAMMQKLAFTFAYPHALERIVIEASELPDVALLGAAALHLDSLEKRI